MPKNKSRCDFHKIHKDFFDGFKTSIWTLYNAFLGYKKYLNFIENDKPSLTLELTIKFSELESQKMTRHNGVLDHHVEEDVV